MLEKPVERFLDELASGAPTPGGGSAAALAGALGAALLSMVSNLTLGREKYAGVQGEIAEIVDQTERLRRALQALVERDVAAYGALAAAYQLPRGDNAEKERRSRAIQEALVGATDVPMQIAETCARVFRLCRPLAEKGNVSAVSDVGVALLLAEAGLRGAMLNVLINLSALKDVAYVDAQCRRLDALLAGAADEREAVLALVVEKL